MENYPTPNNNGRIGIHFLPDFNHYEKKDLEIWLPALESINAQWITLEAQVERAIPETFIRGIVEAGIEPILQFGLKPECPICGDDVGGMLDAYANWGVHYISPFRPPNVKANWPATSWAEKNLVERFVDHFLPLAERIESAGLFAVFPPLVPGGDYWDTSFLRTALETIAGRNPAMLEKMTLGLQAWAGDRDINWGAGGPERWPRAMPYATPEGSQDQMGIRIFDWYKVIAEAAVGRSMPMMVLAGGSAPGKGVCSENETGRVSHADQNREIAKLVSEIGGDGNDADAAPNELLNFNFWILNEGDRGEEHESAWFEKDGKPKASASAVIDWTQSSQQETSTKEKELPLSNTNLTSEVTAGSFAHYLLLPTYEWGVADWHLDVIRPFVKKHQPTVGYSIEEAAHAAKVTVVGGERSFTKDMLDTLRAKGCEVEQIEGDGTKIASQLLTL